MPNVPEQELFELLGDQQDITVATAESCTGGNVAGRITRIAGSSAYMMGGIVSYSNDAKANLLGVSRDVLENPGAVSEECATQMAEGACRALNATFGVSTTGIAGPSGGSPDKPVGMVCFGWASHDQATATATCYFTGQREAVRAQVAAHALQTLLLRL